MTFCPEKSFIRERCTGCSACVEVCPEGAVSMHGGIPRFDCRICIGCGHCGAWCPENCHDLAPSPSDLRCSPDSFVELAASRRSVRQFLQEEIPDSLVAELLSVVQFCPTGVNAQGMTVVVWRGERVRKNLFEPLAALLRHLRLTGLTWLAGILSGQGSFMTRVMGGEDLVFRGAPLVLFFFAPRKNPTGAADGDIAATTVMLHASTMGLGTFWNGVARVVYPVMRGWHAGAPKGGRLRAVLCVGRPLRKPSWLVPGRDWTALEAGNRAEREPVTTGAAP